MSTVKKFPLIIPRKPVTSSKDVIDFDVPQWEIIFDDKSLEEEKSKIVEFLKLQKDKTIFPPKELIFNAFHMCPLSNIRVVILGQDCYHGPNQAMGLAFSVPKNVKIPPSLVNIFKELETDIPGFVKPKHGNLESWAKQGVLLLNSALTVEEHMAGSHLGIWQKFTDRIISLISMSNKNIVFILWGNEAQKKTKIIQNIQNHHIITAAHPSPLSANRGFFGSKCFSNANNYLISKNLVPIDWAIS